MEIYGSAFHTYGDCSFYLNMNAYKIIKMKIGNLNFQCFSTFTIGSHIEGERAGIYRVI